MTVIMVLPTPPASSSSSFELVTTGGLVATVVLSVITTGASVSSVFVSVGFPVPLLMGRRASETAAAPSPSASPSPSSIFPVLARDVSIFSHNPSMIRVNQGVQAAVITRLLLFPRLLIYIPGDGDIHDAILQTLMS